MQEVNLSDMLTARERRANRQQILLKEYALPVISFTMNIAGNIKNSSIIRRAFMEGERMLGEHFQCEKLTVHTHEQVICFTGCESLWVVECNAVRLKKVCMEIEDSCSLGRLFDMDVIEPNGNHLSREWSGASERTCLVCGLPVRACASRRSHPLVEIQHATRDRIVNYFWDKDCKQLSRLVSQSLLNEVLTTPKPGLVDQRNSGSHRDMDLFTFQKSISVLQFYWDACACTGRKTANCPPAYTFSCLRPLGMEAEQAMLQATGNVNTHKGAIFLLGIICGAWGRLWHADAICRDPEILLKECRHMTEETLSKELTQLLTAEPLTSGQRFYQRYAISGVRGEMMHGLPSVLNIALPAFQNALNAGFNQNDSAVVALIHLIAQTEDTNMISRGGLDAAQTAKEQARALLSREPFPSHASVIHMDDKFIERNLSPGGCADLLAVTLFLHSLTNPEINEIALDYGSML